MKEAPLKGGDKGQDSGGGVSTGTRTSTWGTTLRPEAAGLSASDGAAPYGGEALQVIASAPGRTA